MVRAVGVKWFLMVTSSPGKLHKKRGKRKPRASRDERCWKKEAEGEDLEGAGELVVDFGWMDETLRTPIAQCTVHLDPG